MNNHIPLRNDGGKGDKWRNTDFKRYRENYDQIFKKKPKKKKQK